MAKAGWASKEIQRVAKDVKSLPTWVERPARPTAGKPQSSPNAQPPKNPRS
jgi:hypothetical protein